MATQRIVVARIGGDAAKFVSALFQRWHQGATNARGSTEISAAVDEFADRLVAHAHCPPVVYFAQWSDRWSMGDLVPSLGDRRAVVVAGSRYQACCHIPPIVVQATTIDGEDTQETMWLKRRIEEAEDTWKDVVSGGVIVVLREVLGGLVTDQELEESLTSVPPWLASQSNTE